ncbi:fibroblast growth factor receptor 4-like [Branchiostoma floridae]|uniref:receptor protein-tyrosine kinase n=1 Tax=Branchiostoma floridae TaxID=7739 RepID=A0A9J7HG28_BRAFL|nr:fibroblast growth factor receptor 4-like [Branchiostoma floridae]
MRYKNRKFCYSGSAQCDETLRSPAGEISSPGYPGDYPPRVDYTWCVNVEGATGIDVSFLGEFHIELNEDGDGTVTCKDGVEVGQGGRPVPGHHRRLLWEQHPASTEGGHRADVELDVCYSSPCTNGATCLPNLTTYTYTCHCSPGWEGTNCELVAPGALTIETSPPSPSTEEQLNLTCWATGWGFTPNISWYIVDEDSPVDAGLGEQQDTQESDSSFTSIRTLTFTPTKGDNGVTYRCVASHPALAMDVETLMTLNVRYPAEIITPPSITTRVTEGQSVTISCPADGNPGNFIYTWREGGRVIDPSTEHQYDIDNGVLNITSATSDLQGTAYSCEVSNNIGFTPAKASTVLIVDFSAESLNGGGNPTTTIIIVVVVCVVVIIAVVVAAVSILRRAMVSRERQNDAPTGVALEQIPTSSEDGYQSLRLPQGQKSAQPYQGLAVPGDSQRQSTTDVVYEDVKTSSEFPRNQLALREKLGQGEFGNVFRAEAWNISDHQGTTIVAVKTLKAATRDAAQPAFFKELEVLEVLGSHPNVVSFLGCCTDKEPFYLLLEFVPGGTLQSNLRSSRAPQTHSNLHGESKSLSSQDLTKFAWDVAKGMVFLSSKKILHRDLATRNVLVAADKTCKVSDFGISREGEEYERTAHVRLPIRWMAPESLFQRMYTSKSDVWSFGVLLWEIVTLGATPYSGMSSRQVMGHVKHGYRMEKPPHCDGKLYSIMAACWEEQPTERPSFQQLELSLEALMGGGYINLASFDETTYANLQTSGEERC